MSNEDMASRIQVYRKKIEKIRVKRIKREKFKHLLKTLGLSAGRESMALKNVRRYDANGRELTEKDLETFRLDSPVVREILANLNREVTEGIRQKEKKGDD